MNQEYSFWEIWYISYEGNKRWSIARAPEDWTEDRVRQAINMGGVGDDPAEITSVSEVYYDNNFQDFNWYLNDDLE